MERLAVEKRNTTTNGCLKNGVHTLPEDLRSNSPTVEEIENELKNIDCD
ncbi:hypothetical protein [Dyadobacter sp. CY347]|nr:hypothetical protein [Dyadobacter sp. CY347]MCF2490763.1 hypothetical protein [Dyadobacter sp. CY347]